MATTDNVRQLSSCSDARSMLVRARAEIGTLGAHVAPPRGRSPGTPRPGGLTVSEACAMLEADSFPPRAPRINP